MSFVFVSVSLCVTVFENVCDTICLVIIRNLKVVCQVLLVLQWMARIREHTAFLFTVRCEEHLCG